MRIVAPGTRQHRIGNIETRPPRRRDRRKGLCVNPNSAHAGGEPGGVYVLDEVSGKREAIDVAQWLVPWWIGIVRDSQAISDEPARAVSGERQRHFTGS
jgi:hypothetical protein